MINQSNRFSVASKPKKSFAGFFWGVVARLSSYKIGLNKRQKIIIATLILTVGLILISRVNYFIFFKYRLILGFGAVAYVLSVWALWEGLNKTKAIILLILPTFFTIAVISTFFLLKQVNWWTRVPTAIFFFGAFYFLLLAENVFNVASNRTIPLYRAASAAAFMFTVIAAFILYTSVFGLTLPFYWNGVVVALISFPLILHILWSIDMDKISTQVFVYSLIISLLVGESAVALSFWLVPPLIWSLILSATLYVLLGIFTEFMRGRLTARLSSEYVFIGTLVLAISFLSTAWAY